MMHLATLQLTIIAFFASIVYSASIQDCYRNTGTLNFKDKEGAFKSDADTLAFQRQTQYVMVGMNICEDPGTGVIKSLTPII